MKLVILTMRFKSYQIVTEHLSHSQLHQGFQPLLGVEPSSQAELLYAKTQVRSKPLCLTVR